VNSDEWKNSKIAEIEEVYATLKPLNITLKRGGVFDDGIYVDITPETFPYDKATSINAQFIGTGYTEQYDVTVYCWIGRLRACQQFKIRNDKQNKQMISVLSKASKDTKDKIISILKDGLSKYIQQEEKYAYEDGGSSEYAQYILQNPLIQNKIRRAKETMVALTSP